MKFLTQTTDGFFKAEETAIVKAELGDDNGIVGQRTITGLTDTPTAGDVNRLLVYQNATTVTIVDGSFATNDTFYIFSEDYDVTLVGDFVQSTGNLVVPAKSMATVIKVAGSSAWSVSNARPPGLPNIGSLFIWVDGTAGDDTTGDGSELDPFETLERAMDYAREYDISEGDSIYITVAAGTYSNYIDWTHKTAQTITIYGVDRDTVIMNSLFSLNEDRTYIFGYLTAPSFQLQGDVNVEISNCKINSSGGALIVDQRASASCVLVEFTGSAYDLITVQGDAYLNMGFGNTFSATLAVSNSVLKCTGEGANITIDTLPEALGTPTGKRFEISNQGVIVNTAGGISSIPGATAGTIESGGQYIGTDWVPASGTTLSAGMTSMNGATSIAADRYWYTTGTDTFALGTITSAGRAILDDADAAAQRTTLGLAIGSNVQAYSSQLANWAAITGTGSFQYAVFDAAGVAGVLSAGDAIFALVATNTWQLMDAGLTSIAGLTTAADNGIYTTALDTYATYSLTSYGRTLAGLADAAALRTNLALVVGTNVQAYNANLTSWAALAPSAKQDADAGLLSIAGLTTSAGTSIYTTAADTYATYATTASGRALSNIAGTSGNAPYLSGTDTWSLGAVTAGGRALWNVAGTANTIPYFSASNVITLASITAAGLALLDDADNTAQRTTLGLGTVATLSYPGGTTNYLRADGTWAAPGGGGGSSTLSIVASATLTAGQLVNIHSASGAARVRPANATAIGSEANGFVLAGFASSATADVYKPGEIITGLSGLTADASYWLSTTGGGITTTPPSTVGNIVQYVGRALSTTSLYFFPHTPMTVAAP